MPTQDNTSAVRRVRGAAMAIALPEVQAIRDTRGAERRRVYVILSVSAVFMVVIGVAVLMLLGKREATARDAGARFGSAVVHDDPRAAPPGAAGYVRAVRATYGPVSSARVIGSHNKGINTGDVADTRSFFVVEELLATRRGPVAVELAFDNHSINSDRVSGIREITPSSAPGLSAEERHELDFAFAERGGKPATLDATGQTAVITTTPARTGAHATGRGHTATGARATGGGHTASGTRATGGGAGDPTLRCVQRAHGDVAKLQACAGAAG